MTISRGLRRLGLAVATLLAVVSLAITAALLLLDRGRLRSAVETQVQMATGLELAVQGATTISLFPTASITFGAVGPGGGNEAPLNVQELTANLRFVPLLLGRFEIADLVFSNPRIVVRRNADGLSNWEPLISRLERQLQRGAADSVSFSEIRIKNGTLVYQDDAHRIAEVVTAIDVSLAWPSISRSFAATGEFIWRNERVDGSVNIANFAAALAGGRSGLRTRLGSSNLKLAFDGTIANPADVVMDGNLAVDSPSLREALRWVGHDLGSGGGFGRFSLKARASLDGRSLALNKVNVELDGNSAEGALSYNDRDRQTLQGTLAAEALDVTPYISTLRMLAGGSRDWSRQPFDLRNLSGNELDLRLSAARVTAGNTKFGRTAIGLNIQNGALMLSVGEAQIFGGIAKGSFGVTGSKGLADLKAQFQLEDVDLEASLGELIGNRRVAGRGNLDIRLEASGANPFGLAQSLDGRATLTGQNGVITGYNIEQLLRRLERRPLSGAGEFRNGRTPYDSLTVGVRLNDGIAAMDDVRLEGPTVRIVMTGTASIPSRDYDLRGVAGLLSASGATPTFELPFVVQGPWDDPLIFPDSESLLRRSPASAPLLDAVRDRRARDAVKSAIERLTGSRPAPAEPPAATGQAR